MPKAIGARACNVFSLGVYTLMQTVRRNVFTFPFWQDVQMPSITQYGAPTAGNCGPVYVPDAAACFIETVCRTRSK